MTAMSTALAVRVARTSAQARLSGPDPRSSAALESGLYRALDELARTRPRIVEFAPDVALQRALTRLGLPPRQRNCQISAVPARGVAR